MTSRDVFLPVSSLSSLEEIVDLAVYAELLGYDRVWFPETWGREAATVLTTIAERTEQIGLGTSVLNVYSRSPALLGQLAATQQEACDGRFRLGIGPSGPLLIEGWHGRAFDDPLRHTREAIEIIRAVQTGHTVTYQGTYYDLAGFRLRSPPPNPAAPIDAAGLGPKAVELAGRFADGWHALSFTRSGIESRLADFNRGVALGNRDREDLRVTLGVTSCALEDDEQARALAAGHLAFYVGGMGTFYRDNLARQGYADRAERIAHAWGNGEREHAIELVRDGLLDELAAAGNVENARDQFATFTAIDGVDAVAVAFPRGADRHELRTTMTALAPTDP